MSTKDQYEVTPQIVHDDRECDVQIRMVAMRDGRKLYTTVYLPPGITEPVGTVFIRSPYFRREYLGMPNPLALKHGFAAVCQHCRGTAGSEGEFFPSHPEFEEHDGEDTVKWIIQQPWSNGRVALMGSSYSGLTQWATAYCGNGAITGFTPHVAALCGCLSMGRKGGGSSHGFMISWGLSMFHRNKFGYDNVPDYDAHLFHLPVNEMDLHFNYGVVEHYRDFIRTTQKPGTFTAGLEEKIRQVTVPALVSGGWFDGFKTENILSFQMMKTLAATEKARQYTRMVIGPWIHGGLLNKEELGEENDHRDLTPLQERFVTGTLNDPEKDPVPDCPPVRFFMLGTNRWCSSQVWPPSYREKKLFLRSGNGLADTPEEKSDASSAYTYDPADPTPSYNGKRTSLGYYDRSTTEKRSDMVLFTSKVLEEPLTIAGTVRVRLFARSSAPDTDFYATLTDVYPDGRSMFLVTGMVRARFSRSLEKEEFLKPGELREYEIDLGDIANTFVPGHTVRLAIHSANFPAESRNLNTKAPVNEGVTMLSAFQELFHSSSCHSCLILPESTDKF